MQRVRQSLTGFAKLLILAGRREVVFVEVFGPHSRVVFLQVCRRQFLQRLGFTVVPEFVGEDLAAAAEEVPVFRPDCPSFRAVARRAEVGGGHLVGGIAECALALGGGDEPAHPRWHTASRTPASEVADLAVLFVAVVAEYAGTGLKVAVEVLLSTHTHAHTAQDDDDSNKQTSLGDGVKPRETENRMCH